MHRRTLREWMPLRLLFFGAVLFFVCWGSVALGAKVQLVDPENHSVFFPDEPIELRVIVLLDANEWGSLTEPVLSYTVTDFWDRSLLEGQQPVQMPTATGGWADLALRFPTEARGWFRVDLSLIDGDREVPLRNPDLATGEPYITFAVIDPPEPGPRPDSYFGICEHYLNEANAELMRRAGVRWLRTDVRWQEIQPEREAPFDWSRLDDIVETAARYGISVLPIIDYAAPFAVELPDAVREGSITRYPPREEDWRRFVHELVKRYRGQVSVWEVWNEANASFWLGTPERYADLLKQAYEEIRAVDPSASVSIAGTYRVDVRWLEEVVIAGGGPYMDIVSVHPYRQPAPPDFGLADDLTRVITWAREALPPSQDGGVARPVWITEMGYHTLADHLAVSEKKQAEYLVRAMTEALASGVERFFWYEFADGSVNPRDKEANFGVVYHNLMPKPAYVAYATMERLLGQVEHSRSLAFHDQRIRAYAFTSGDQEIVVAWAVGEAQTISWPVQDTLLVIDIMGRRREIMPQSQEVTLELTDSPIYLIGLDLTAMERDGLVLVSANPLPSTELPSERSVQNIVYNGSFEERGADNLPSGWSVHVRGDAAFEWEYRTGTDDAADGHAYMRLRNNSSRGPHVYGRIYQVLQVEPWTTYTVKLKVRTHNNTLAWIGGGPGWNVRFQLPRETEGAWVDVRGLFTTGSETTWELMVLLEDIDEWVDVDAIRVMKGIVQ